LNRISKLKRRRRSTLNTGTPVSRTSWRRRRRKAIKFRGKSSKKETSSMTFKMRFIGKERI
jgi:hypothetical protein